MIPPDLLARAREAFTEAGGGHAGLEAALSVLSAAWPEADGRLREAAERVLTPWEDRMVVDSASMAALRAALAAFPEADNG